MGKTQHSTHHGIVNSANLHYGHFMHPAMDSNGPVNLTSLVSF